MPTATGSVTATATLTDSGGNPVSGATYTFNYQVVGAPSWTTGGTAVTNAAGVATYQYTGLVAGLYNFEAVFTQTATDNGSIGTVSSFQVRVNTTTVMVASSP